MLEANKLLTMAKEIEGLCLIVVRKVFFLLIIRSIVLQHQGLLQEHLSPHQFKISTLGGFEAILFNIKAFFNLHPN
jgi:hypothetical protein